MKARYIDERKLLFGKKKDAFEPRVGLLKYGPFGPSENEEIIEFKKINCGIIGIAGDILKLRDYFKKVSLGLDAEDSTFGNLGFPGLHQKSPLRFSIRFLDSYIIKIKEFEVIDVIEIEDFNERKNKLIDLFDKKHAILYNIDPPPEVIFVLIPEAIITAFRRPEFQSTDIKFASRNDPDSVQKSQGDIDFHSIMKISGMQYNIPNQVIKPEFFIGKREDGSPLEDPVTMAWNLSVAIYYKAKKIPWKFSKLDENTCYAGISFFRDFSKRDVYLNTAMAQIFLDTGESFILRGESFENKEKVKYKAPNLGYNVAKDITEKIISQYKEVKGFLPNRVVIHKSSNFNDEEIRGILQNSFSVKIFDLITIMSYSDIRVFRKAQFPVMRGTLISTDEPYNRYFLFTHGFLPSLGTYPGMRVPIPIEIRKFTQNSDIDQICSEILILTRLDWNNIKYCQRMPVTLAFAEKVGNILAERRAINVTIPIHYRFYM